MNRFENQGLQWERLKNINVKYSLMAVKITADPQHTVENSQEKRMERLKNQ